MSGLSEPPTAVLVVEDEDLIRAITAFQLEDAGFAVIQARDATQALAEFADHPEVSAVFTDINMPGPVDGVALARRIHDLRPNVQLIITSGRAPPLQSEMPSGARFLPKPYDGRYLATLIRRRPNARRCPPPGPRRPRPRKP